MLEKQQDKNKDVKRGENVDTFEILSKLVQIDGKKTDKGYKLFDFISDEEGELRKTRQKLLQKGK